MTAVKTFGKDRCLLCNQERLNIFKWFRLKPDKLINKCHEIYGACKHKPKFHRFKTALSSTDESKRTKVRMEKVTTEANLPVEGQASIRFCANNLLTFAENQRAMVANYWLVAS